MRAQGWTLLKSCIYKNFLYFRFSWGPFYDKSPNSAFFVNSILGHPEDPGGPGVDRIKKGHIKKVGWSFITLKPQGCIVVKLNYVYQFINIEIGEEYILSVSNICEGKYRSEDELASLVTH